MLLAIVLVAGIDAWSSYPVDQKIEQQTSANAESYQEQRGPSEGYWWPEVSARDTYAQWAMAVLAVAATIISVVALRFLRDTLHETRYVGRAQVRSYVSVGGIIFDQNSLVGESAKLLITNNGQSPALEVQIGSTVFNWNTAYPLQVPDDLRLSPLTYCEAGETWEARIYPDNLELLNDVEKNWDNNPLLAAVLAGKVQHKTVFGETYETHFLFAYAGVDDNGLIKWEQHDRHLPKHQRIKD